MPYSNQIQVIEYLKESASEYCKKQSLLFGRLLWRRKEIFWFTTGWWKRYKRFFNFLIEYNNLSRTEKTEFIEDMIFYYRRVNRFLDLPYPDKMI